MRNNGSRAVRACALLCASVSLPSVAWAQLAGEVAPPERASVDGNGVNVATGTYRGPHVDLTVGSGSGALSVVRVYSNVPYQNAFITVRNTPSTLVVNTDERDIPSRRAGAPGSRRAVKARR